MDRVETTELVVRTLKRRKPENEYYKTFVRLVDVMKKIKSFILDVSQIQGFKKYSNASTIKDRFNSLVREFEDVMTDLHFTMTVSNEEQRRLNQENLNEDIKQLKHVFKKFFFL